MKNISLILFILLFSISVNAQADRVFVAQNEDGMKLKVNDKDFMINGMNWDYFPIGTNYTYSLWAQPDALIEAALKAEMTLLKNMGVNAVRQYTSIPAKWITHIYEEYGIYTMLNHAFGRYGVLLGDTYVNNTDYADPRARELLLKEVKQLAEDYKNTPGLLMYLLGNENNYGLFWGGAETEDIPSENPESIRRARAMYKLFEEATVAMQAIDKSHPIAICNGDLLFLDLIIEECKSADIFGTNMYRGLSFGDAFQKIKEEYGKPIMFTEFGTDAYHTLKKEEDQFSQAKYMTGNWKEIYENAAGLGKAENSIGGFTFQFSDGWWKFGQTLNLDVHDDNASWANGGYENDFKKGENNMNEEWFGICAKGATDEHGLYQLHPRAAYYALKKVHKFDPLKKGVSLNDIDKHFNCIKIEKAVKKAKK